MHMLPITISKINVLYSQSLGNCDTCMGELIRIIRFIEGAEGQISIPKRHDFTFARKTTNTGGFFVDFDDNIL